MTKQVVDWSTVDSANTSPLPTGPQSLNIIVLGTALRSLLGAVARWRDAAVVSRTAVPSTATSTGTVGQIAFDTTHLYVCVATDTWRRVAIATW